MGFLQDADEAIKHAQEEKALKDTQAQQQQAEETKAKAEEQEHQKNREEKDTL